MLHLKTTVNKKYFKLFIFWINFLQHLQWRCWRQKLSLAPWVGRQQKCSLNNGDPQWKLVPFEAQKKIFFINKGPSLKRFMPLCGRSN
jgi:hypothetical protein